MLPFLAAQLVGAAVGVGIAVLLFPRAASTADELVVPATFTAGHPQS